MGQVVVEDTGNYYGYDLQDRKMKSSRRRNLNPNREGEKLKKSEAEQ